MNQYEASTDADSTPNKQRRTRVRGSSKIAAASRALKSQTKQIPTFVMLELQPKLQLLCLLRTVTSAQVNGEWNPIEIDGTRLQAYLCMREG